MYRVNWPASLGLALVLCVQHGLVGEREAYFYPYIHIHICTYRPTDISLSRLSLYIYICVYACRNILPAPLGLALVLCVQHGLVGEREAYFYPYIHIHICTYRPTDLSLSRLSLSLYIYVYMHKGISYRPPSASRFFSASSTAWLVSVRLISIHISISISAPINLSISFSLSRLSLYIYIHVYTCRNILPPPLGLALVLCV